MVTVYTKDNCVQCSMTKKFLKNNNVEFQEIDMMNDDSARDKVISMGYTSAPVVITENDSWSGFRDNKLKELL